MKKLVLLAAVVAFTASCNKKAGGNKGVIEEEHAPATVEQMHGDHASHGTHETEDAHASETHDTVALPAIKVDSTAVVK